MKKRFFVNMSLKLKIFIVGLLLPFISFAEERQAKHAEFMGIPIDGSITNFTIKLQSKGFNYIPNNWAEGKKRFFGQYFGYDAHIIVNYIPQTKTVYNVNVIIECRNANKAEALRENFKDACVKKFGEGDLYEGMIDGQKIYHMKISDWDNRTIYKDETGEFPVVHMSVPCSGYIQIFVDEEYYNLVHINFYDKSNYDKYEQYLIDSSF